MPTIIKKFKSLHVGQKCPKLSMVNYKIFKLNVHKR